MIKGYLSLAKVSLLACMLTLACQPIPPTHQSGQPGQPTQPTAAQPTTGMPQLGPGQQPTSSFAASGGTPALAADPSGRSPLLVPSGWTVNTSAEGQRTFLRIDETPGRQDSPMLGLVSQPLSTGANGEGMVGLVASQMQNGQLVAQRQLAPGVVFYLMQGVINNIPAKMAAVGASDAQFAFATFFVAPAARFDALGGENLLFAAMGMGSGAATATAPTRTAHGPAAANVDVSSYNGQMQLLANKSRVDPTLLVGKWSQGTSVPMGNVYEDAVSGSLSYDSIGHGNFFEFRADGSYAYVHNYAQTYYNCRNSIKSGETGTYQFDGLTLVLTPNQYSAEVCSCCAGRPRTKQSRNSAKRTYEVAVHPQGQALVIRGTCPEYIISCVGDQPKYQREGFYRH